MISPPSQSTAPAPVFQAIAAVAENGVIGNQGQIPWHLPLDFRWFKRKTMGSTLVMGRKTFASIGKSLPGRKTVVLTRKFLDLPEVTTCSDLKQLADFALTPDRCLWICGGAEIYQLLLPNCSFFYLTRVKLSPPGDTFFPPLPESFLRDQILFEDDKMCVERYINPSHVSIPAQPEMWPLKPAA